jgi:hypothetical protein
VELVESRPLFPPLAARDAMIPVDLDDHMAQAWERASIALALLRGQQRVELAKCDVEAVVSH